MRNCLIFGSGRCGTSALAGALAHSGVYVGLHPMGPTSQMPLGYWEDRWINAWNNQLLSQVCDYKGLFIAPVPLEAGQKMALAKFSDPVRVQRMFWFTPYALKDPRFAFTYKAWKPLLVQPNVCIVLFRNPSDFVDSALRLRSDHSIIASQRDALETMWENSYQHVLANDDGTFCYIEHEEIINGNAKSYLERLLGYPIKWSFIEPKLCHSTEAKCPDRLWPLYHELQGRAANREQLF
jgi:hypothetical protein